MYALNPVVHATSASPIDASKRWIEGRVFPDDQPLLNVAQAVPGYPPAAALTAHLAERLHAPAMALYTPIFGIPDLRAALAGQLNAEYGGAIRPEQTLITAGCNQGFCAVTTALAAPGDEIILPLPYYFNHEMWLTMQGIRVVGLPFAAAHNGVPDPVAAAQLITPRTRAIVLVTPNNPTGAIYPPAVIKAFYDLARAHNIALILDETYKDFLPAGPAHALFREPDWPETLIQLYSFSKVYCLTGYRVGSVVCDGRLAEEIAKFQDCVAICAPRIGQEAALYGLQHLNEWKAEKSRLMQRRAQALVTAFQTSNMLRYELVTVGAYFAYVRHPFAGEAAVTVARRLADEHNLLCLPGSNFGPDQEDYLRLAFANLEEAQIGVLIERLLASQA